MVKDEIQIKGRYLLQTKGGKYLCDNIRCNGGVK